MFLVKQTSIKNTSCGINLSAVCSPSWMFLYTDVTMGTIASKITSFTIVYSTVYSDADQRKYQSSASLAFVQGNSPEAGEFPAQMASYEENVSIWWRLHVLSRLTFNLKTHSCLWWIFWPMTIYVVDGGVVLSIHVFKTLICLVFRIPTMIILLHESISRMLYAV